MFHFISSGVLKRERYSPHHTEIQQEVQKEASKYVRHTLRTAQSQFQNTPTPPATSAATKEKDALLPAKIQASYAAIDALAAEKLALAQRVVALIARARARLEHDLGRVLVLQGGAPEAAASTLAAVSGSGSGSGGALGGRNPATQITESLRNAFAGSAVLGAGDVLPLSPLSLSAAAAAASASDAQRQTKRACYTHGSTWTMLIYVCYRA